MDIINKFKQQLKDYVPSSELYSTLLEISSQIPILDSIDVFDDLNKFNEFCEYVGAFNINTKRFVTDKDEKLDLTNLTSDKGILDYWNRAKIFVIISVMAGSPENVPEKFSFGYWFQPIKTKMAELFDRYKIPSNLRFIGTEQANKSVFAEMQKNWFNLKDVDHGIVNDIKKFPIYQRCWELLNDNPFVINDLITSLTHTLDFLIASSIFRFKTGDDVLSRYLRFYVSNNNKYPSTIMRTFFPNDGNSRFPNPNLNKFIYNQSIPNSTEIQHFSTNFWEKVHSTVKENVVRYFENFVSEAQQDLTPKKYFNLQSNDVDVTAYAFEMQSNIDIFLDAEIKTKPIVINSLTNIIYPQEWKDRYPFYFDDKNTNFVPQPLYPPNFDQQTLPSYFLGPNLKQEVDTFNQLNIVLKQKLPTDQSPLIYTNDNFWYKTNQIYHAMRFSPRPPSKENLIITISNGAQLIISVREINKAYAFEEEVRKQKSIANPNFENSFLNTWAQKLVNNNVSGTLRLDLLIDVILFNLGISLSDATEIGVSPYILDLLKPPISTSPISTPTPTTTVSEFFTSRKGRNRRSRNKRRSISRKRRTRPRRVQRLRNSRRRRLT